MSNRFMISVAALALVAGTGLANAQGAMNRESGGGAGAQQMQHAQPSGGGAERGAMDREGAGKGTVGQAGGASGMKSDRAEDKSSGAMKDERPGGAMNKTAAEDKAGATKSGAKDMKAEDNKAGAANKNNAENRPAGGTSTDMKAEGRNSTSTTVGQAGAGAKLSTEQRTQITTVIRDERVAPVTNVNFSISIGTRVPRDGIEFHALPARVVTIYPEWRDYRYILVRDEIVIIDPNTYEIVAVLNV
ncbi:DUF1236 domain-containing protein [Bradyrhizobium sp.]|uniref:DUF1236 domain-containing protein n=1 Tax=Bradyrhizobium sp. TaxID=376 RepID=UPI0039E2E6C9